MERKPFRKFKRSLKKEKYGEKYKKQMKMTNFKKDDFLFDIEVIDEIKERKITQLILSLPKEIQKKLYILTMRKYWKNTVMNTIYKPMYYDYYSYIEKEKGKVYYDNIHFMHLEFNTLESNKEWIPGCQCDFCLDDNHLKYTKEYKQDIYDKLLEEYDMEEYRKCIHCYDENPNFWNINYNYCIMINPIGNFHYCLYSHKIYDPLKNAEHSIYEKINYQDSPIYFSEELISSYH